MSIADVRKVLGCDNIGQLMLKITSAKSMTTYGQSGNYSCAIDDIKFFVKIALYSVSVYDHWKVPDAPSCAMVDAEINIMRAIKTKIIDRGYCPHFVEILALSRCENIAKFILDKDKCKQQQLGRASKDHYPQSLLCTFMEIVNIGLAIDKFALVFSEFCEFSVSEYIMRHAPLFPSIRDQMIISIIFQIYYSLEVAKRVWSGFRHGDMFPYNIMIKLAPEWGENFSTGERHYLRYVLDGHTWNVPFFGFFVKIIDFGHSEIPEEGIISSVHHVGDMWIPDHVLFIIHFEALIQEAQFMTAELQTIFNALNREHITHDASALQIMQLARTFINTDAALSTIFRAFENEVNKELVLQEYNGPPAH